MTILVIMDWNKWNMSFQASLLARKMSHQEIIPNRGINFGICPQPLCAINYHFSL